MSDHLFTSSEDGALYDTRAAEWSRRPPLRAVYRRTFSTIATAAELKATLRAGCYAWPGAYPLYFVTSDGAALSFESVRAELRQVLNAIVSGANDGWRVVACQVNWEDSELTCDHSGKPIESAYGDAPSEESDNA